MADNRISVERVRNHWAYSWWKYAIMAFCVVFGVNMFFTMTAYRSPENKKVELYLCKGYAESEMVYEDLWPVLLELAPEQEELSLANINLLDTSDYTTVMQFSTYIAAQQGDILLLPRAEYKRYVAEDIGGFFADLSAYIEEGQLDVTGMDLSGTTEADSEGNTGVYGIPADYLYGLTDYRIDPADSVLVITSFSGNEETCVKLLDAMIKMYSVEKPEGYDAWHESMSGKKNATQIFY